MDDPGYDCRHDAGTKDPDYASPTLRRTHQVLWSKPLPSGHTFDLDLSIPGRLRHRSALGEFLLSSDSLIHTYSKPSSHWPQLPAFAERVRSGPDRHLVDRAWSAAECIVFPANKRDGKMTINGARGTNRQLDDRFDLALECIRRHYEGGQSPLSGTLQRYGDFFRLFGNFTGYVEFFLLQDLLDERGKVRYFHPFQEFGDPPLPADHEAYVKYLRAADRFATARLARMRAWMREHGHLA